MLFGILGANGCAKTTLKNPRSVANPNKAMNLLESMHHNEITKNQVPAGTRNWSPRSSWLCMLIMTCCDL